jgi:hypothetical protein
MIILKSKMFKKLTLSLILAVYTFFALIPHVTPSYAQQSNNWWNPSFEDFQRKVNDPGNSEIFGERYTYAQVTWIIYSLAMLLMSDNKVTKCLTGDFTAIDKCLGPTIQSPFSLQANINSPILAIAGITDSLLTTKPASGVSWVASVIQSHHLIPEAKAQTGYGFTTLTPSQKLWAISRNFSYALMTVATIILAFMIMFRVKISAQLSVSIQSAIPRVAIGLVLITFSYAIIGFMVDLAYLSQHIVALMFSQSGVSAANPIDLFQKINNGSMGVLSLGLVIMIPFFSAAALSGVIGAASAGTLSVVFLGALLLLVLVAITFIIAALKIFYLLLKTYVIILLLTIAVPFQVLLSVASPQASLWGWLRGIVGHIAIFPTVSILILFAHTIFWGGINANLSGLQFINPFQINGQAIFSGSPRGSFPTFRTTNDFELFIISLLAALMIMLSIPSIANSIRSYIQTGRTQAPQLGFGLMGAAAVAGYGLVRKEGESLAGSVLGGYMSEGRAKTMSAVVKRLPPRYRESLESMASRIPRYKAEALKPSMAEKFRQKEQED